MRAYSLPGLLPALHGTNFVTFGGALMGQMAATGAEKCPAAGAGPGPVEARAGDDREKDRQTEERQKDRQ